MRRAVGRVPAVIAGAPLRTVRPVMLRELYANPEKELVRMRDAGTLTRVAHGTYVAKPDRVPPEQAWKPPLEEAAMAYATAAYGDRVPVLMSLGAARQWHAIPRAIGVTVIAVPTQHRPVHLATGGTVVFTVRDLAAMATVPVQTGLGPLLVTTVEQTLVDLIVRPDLGGMPDEAAAAARALRDRVDGDRLDAVIAGLKPAWVRTVTGWLTARDEL